MFGGSREHRGYGEDIAIEPLVGNPNVAEPGDLCGLSKLRELRNRSRPNEKEAEARTTGNGTNRDGETPRARSE